MSGNTQGKTKIEVLGNQKICPLMSARQAQVVPGGGVITSGPITAPMMVPCFREKCELWDEGDGSCCLRDIGQLSVIRSSLQFLCKSQVPPIGETPLQGIDNSLSEILKIVKSRADRAKG
jgi:hypothetical protein